MKVVVTGGAGFIGANLVRLIEASQSDVEVVVLDDLSTGYASNLDGRRATVVIGSVADPDAIAEATDGADAIVHLGALGSVPRSVKDPIASHTANLSGTLNVMEAARRNDAYVVFASSSSVYGANVKLPKSEFDWTRPLSPYAVTKLGAEAYVSAYRSTYGLATLAFRFFNVYGPLQSPDHAYAAVIPRFLDAAMRGDSLTVHGDGLQTRDFTHVDSVCAALWSAVTNRVSLQDPVNLAFGTRSSLLDLIRTIEAQLEIEVEVEHVEKRAGDVRDSQSDGLRIREFFPDVAPVELVDGLASTIAWFRSR